MSNTENPFIPQSQYPAATSVTALTELALLADVKQKFDLADANDPLKHLYDQEMKVFKLTTKLLENPFIQARYGTGMDSIKMLGPLVKQELNKREFQAVMDEVIPNTVLDANIRKLNIGYGSNPTRIPGTTRPPEPSSL